VKSDSLCVGPNLTHVTRAKSIENGTQFSLYNAELSETMGRV